MLKVLYVYAGLDRIELENKVAIGEAPDTSFFGLRHLSKAGEIESDYLQITKAAYGFGGSFFRRYALTRSIYVSIKFYSRLSRYHAVVVTSSSYFGILWLKRLGLLPKTKFFLVNLDLNIRFKRLEKKHFQRSCLLSTINIAEKIICISKHQEKYLLELGIDPEKTEFVPLGVDKNFYAPVESSKEIVLTIGRDAGRDFPTFLEAIGGMSDPSVMICSPRNLKNLEDKIPKNLTVLYDQPYSVLKEHYKKAKLFVITTKPEQNLVGSDCSGQTVALDALAYGIPLVATEMPWFEGYFEAGLHITIAPPSNPVALRESIKSVTADASIASRLSVEGRRLIDEQCNSEAMGKRIGEIILRSF